MGLASDTPHSQHAGSLRDSDVRLTHKGDCLGIPATGKAYKFDAVDIFRIQDGKLAEHWDVLDVYSLFKQLGTIK